MDPLALLTGLLQIYSPSDGEAEAVAYLVSQMQAAGFRAYVDPAGNAVGEIGNGPDEIILLGHIDTVPGFIPVRLDDGKLFGRGSVDAKGPLATFVAAAAQAGAVPSRRLVVIGAVGEEGDSQGAAYVVDHYGPRAPGAAAGAQYSLIIGEPSGWARVTLGYKGSLWARYKARRSVAHTAALDESACEVAVAFWNRLTGHAAEFNRGRGAERVFDRLTATLRGMNSQSDGFEDTATLQMGLRLPPGLSVDDLVATIRDQAGSDEVEFAPGAVPAYRAEKNTALVRAFLSSIRASGGSPSFTVKTGTSDMNIVAPGWGCPTVAYGPGDSALDHTPNEHIQVEEFLEAAQVLARVLGK